MKTRILVSAAALVASSGIAMAATSDISSHRRADFYAPGKHQFYAWCSNGQDRRLAQTGESARDAEAKLAQTVAGSCRLTWQGRIPS
jgi:hypothetical protein